MIMAEDLPGREKALAKLLPMQRQDFAELFRIMDGLPVTIRLLDPPLHEFLPHAEAEMQEIANETGTDLAAVRARATRLREVNPMLGHRGCRLAVTYPEIYEMQARAIFEAAIAVKKETGRTVVPEVMIPLITGRAELKLMQDLVEKVAKAVRDDTGEEVEYSLGTMIELPRAALRAGEIAELAEFFSFGTNDLTQTCYGLSRDDAGNFLDEYEKKKIIPHDPFVSIDEAGVGELMKIATERGRASRPELKLGICGEHGGDPASVKFCAAIGLNYVSCSPYRVPIARLAAAQAALQNPEHAATGKNKAARPSDDRHKRVLIAAGRRSAASRISGGVAHARPQPAARSGMAVNPVTAPPKKTPVAKKARRAAPKLSPKKGPKGRGGKSRGRGRKK
jgi:pyruvate,orthophosphate dikinase